MSITDAVQELELRCEHLEEQLQKAIIAKEKAQRDAAWYRARLLKFVTTKWVKQERERDGV